mmetsp:Transcript_15323/g.34358  ORF Transcript_15323/g.34358 Transcript_15323/m.34358 type:complete len:1069 (-) Transcript_15323:151-3357(-)|eukprot:CAMPEP_0113316946 /NCGR_PEP_ID=MMETSP0010_2-20120614/12031_1 /TAXON_ID=216773 ORGANISM="Corethron hystrix, Strain 308" /NCGR_SAMPLE_ID=MMETSP0010_2 /ASSEMBLY_ACC=CAM_ASM_000155 /LENGTH=1068 /DNA_ID=CAMNT_0000173789 /DNA_START=96 /DNA_END=3302 /DNA_ORIENTATION=+ /assembly_acc=CAM_ASM_000155
MENPQPPTISWHSLTVAETVEKLGRNPNLPEVGLTSEEAKELLEKHGPNAMTAAEKETIWMKIYHHLANVLVMILLTVAAVSCARAIVEMKRETKDSTTILTSWIQVGLILFVITANTIMGIYQEGNAEKAAEALKSMLSADATVRRNGTQMMVPASEVVPGDIVLLNLGDRIPADMRMVKVANLASGEAALTGECVPIDKTTDFIPTPEGSKAEQIPLGDRHNMCFSATLIAQGSGEGIVISTGDYTQIGTINKLVSNVKPQKTNVLKQIDTVSKLLAVLIGIFTLATFLVARFKSGQTWFDSVSTALVCCVAMVPEGLEAIVTITYSTATTIMAKNNAIIRALPSVETLGSVTVICSDKTGTLTQNIMSLTSFVTSNARYKFDVNSSDRVPTNFVRDDTYLAERALGVVKKEISDIIEDGPNSGKKRTGHATASNPFPVTDKDIHASGNATLEVVENEPVAKGGSPTKDYVESVLAGGVLCSKCVLGKNGTREGEMGNPTEISILRAAYFSGVDIDDMKTSNKVIAEVPFSSDYKFMATVHDAPGDDYIVHVKGAPDRMVAVCNTQAKAGVINDLEPIDPNYWIEEIAILSSHGLRVLALTRGTIPKSEVKEGDNLGAEFVNGRETGWLTMVGLCAIMDPPRPECVDAIKIAHGAGVRVAMITGDHKDTALAIGHELGIVDDTFNAAVTGPELDEMDDLEVEEVVMTHNVFARASPQNKIRIVKALQAKKQITSMTGDGVNDAPALKAADMGVAMGLEGTDVAREASDMVLADDNFATIVTAVREGRVVWDNLRKVLFINTPINNAQGLSVLLALACGMKESPLSPIQVLYSNLVCAITLGIVPAVEIAEDGIMGHQPRRIGKRLIGRYLLLRILLATVVLTGCVVGSAFWLMGFNKKLGIVGLPKMENDICSNKLAGVYCLEHARALAFNVLDFGAIGVTLSARLTYLSSMHPRILHGNPSCWWSILIVTVLQVALTYIPFVNSRIFQMAAMDGISWGITFLMTAIVFAVMEVEKGVRRNLKNSGVDTDDEGYGFFDNPKFRDSWHGRKLLPKGASNLKLVSLEK